MVDNPLVSVVMPVYMVERYIEESVQSVLRQTYSPIELILVDDGSTDKSIELAERLLKNSAVSWQIIRQENRGLGGARNTGLEKAQGKWICFLDADDLLSDNAIEHMLLAGEEQQVDLVFSRFNDIYDYTKAIRLSQNGECQVFFGQEIRQAFLKREKVILAPGTLYRKDMLNEFCLRFERIPWSEDQQFMWRVLYRTDKVAFLNEPLYQYLHHSNSIMTGAPISKMVQSFPKIRELTDLYGKDDEVGMFIVPRWVMGTMNAASHSTDYSQWKELYGQLDAKDAFRRLRSFPQKSVRLLAIFALIFPRGYYAFFRRK